MKIELYEPYHIGIKFTDIVNMDTLKIQLTETLKEKKYEIIKEQTSFPLEKIKETIALKKETRIELLYKGIAINIIRDLTKSPDDIIDSFNDIIDILKELDYDLEKTILFFDLVSNLTIKTDKKPMEVLNKSIKIDLGTFDDLNKINIKGLSLRSEKSKYEFLEIILEPRSISPKNKYWFSFVFRTKEKIVLENFHKNLKNNIINILNKFESG